MCFDLSFVTLPSKYLYGKWPRGPESYRSYSRLVISATANATTFIGMTAGHALLPEHKKLLGKGLQTIHCSTNVALYGRLNRQGGWGGGGEYVAYIRNKCTSNYWQQCVWYVCMWKGLATKESMPAHKRTRNKKEWSVLLRFYIWCTASYCLCHKAMQERGKVSCQTTTPGLANTTTLHITSHAHLFPSYYWS